MPIQKCIGVTQNQFHGAGETVYDHLLYSLDASVKFTDNLLLRLAILLHDIGKPAAKTEDEKGIHFYCHEIIGAKIAYQWMRDSGFSREECRYVNNLISHHMFHLDDNAKPRVIRKWLREIGPTWRDLIVMRLSDRTGNLANKDRPLITQNMRTLQAKIDKLYNQGGPIFNEDLAIDYHTLSDEMLDKIWSAVLSRPNQNTREFIEKFLRSQNDKITG